MRFPSEQLPTTTPGCPQPPVPGQARTLKANRRGVFPLCPRAQSIVAMDLAVDNVLATIFTRARLDWLTDEAFYVDID